MSGCEFLTAGGAADALAEGELRSEELVEALLARIERLEPRLGAFAAVYADEARTAARAADLARRAGQAVGRFHGVPIALKDIIDVEGRVTTGGSRVWEARVSPVTATLARRLVAAGIIVLGKTKTVEFAMGAWGTNRYMGTPWNPWDLDEHRAPGGSSSGSGVGVAARLAPWAIGTDTGGSVRIPSAWNGLTGLKVTFGRVSCHGVLPLAHTLDTPGPMCRSVEDAADLYELIQGPDPLDPATLRVPAPTADPRRQPGRGVAGMRLARMPDEERGGVDPEMLAAYDEALGVLAGLGASVVDVALPRRFAEMGDLVGRIIAAEGYTWVGEYIDDDRLPVDDDVRPRIRPGRNMPARDYIAVQRERAAIKREFDAALAGAGVDALLTPAARTPAPTVIDIDQSTTAATFTRPFNLIDYCALVVPNGRTAAGLPLSLQIACPGYGEGTALRIGGAFQRATGWHSHIPPGLDQTSSGREPLRQGAEHGQARSLHLARA